MQLLRRAISFLDKGHSRSVKAKKNVLISVFVKGLGMFIGFVYYPLSLDFLGVAKFGIYLTLMSMVDWFLDLNIGIGHGLRNKFGEAIAHKDDKKALHYVSTAYIVLGAIVVIIMFSLLVGNLFIPWSDWLIRR